MFNKQSFFLAAKRIATPAQQSRIGPSPGPVLSWTKRTRKKPGCTRKSKWKLSPTNSNRSTRTICSMPPSWVWFRPPKWSCPRTGGFGGSPRLPCRSSWRWCWWCARLASSNRTAAMPSIRTRWVLRPSCVTSRDLLRCKIRIRGVRNKLFLRFGEGKMKFCLFLFLILCG